MSFGIRDSLKTLRVLAGTALILAFWPVRAGELVSAAPRSDLDTLLWPVPGTLRRDQAGQALTGARLADRIVVVSFLTTGCTITCVVRTRDLAAIERSLPGPLRARVAVLAISLDPARDDRRALRAFASSLGLDPTRFAVLDSDPDTAARQRAVLRYPADRSDPPDRVLVFDRIGQLAMSYGASPLDRPRLARDLAELDRFAQGVGHPPASSASPAL